LTTSACTRHESDTGAVALPAADSKKLVASAPGTRIQPATDDQWRWRSFTYDELLARDKGNLDITWLRDESLEDSANLPPPDVLAAEIAEELRAALEQFDSLAQSLGSTNEEGSSEL